MSKDVLLYQTLYKLYSYVVWRRKVLWTSIQTGYWCCLKMYSSMDLYRNWI